MAELVILPKQGNSVEACILLAWQKKRGDPINEGEVLCEVETDKAVMEVTSPETGTLLETLYEEGDEVPVLTNIAVIGEPGEDISALLGELEGKQVDQPSAPAGAETEIAPAPADSPATPNGSSDPAKPASSPQSAGQNGKRLVSPRARKLAASKGIDIPSLAGSGPRGRVVEKDVRAALEHRAQISPLAQTMLEQGGFSAPGRGSGPRGRIMSRDLQSTDQAGQTKVGATPFTDPVHTIAVKGVRKLIAERMLHSLQSTAQLTLDASADARALLAARKLLKQSAEKSGLNRITINDLLLFIVSRTLSQFPELNALFSDGVIHQYQAIHLAFAVDTPRGLIVPVIKDANRLSLAQISAEALRLSAATQEGRIAPDELQGGTFTVSNLGGLGIESFTPILNPPQVGILGVGNINLKPVEVDGNLSFIPHISLSLTINHQVVDGAPGARFLQELSSQIGDAELVNHVQDLANSSKGN